MALDFTITGSKDDLAEHLRTLAAGHAATAKKMGKDAAAQESGRAEGLLEAATALDQWIGAIPDLPSAGSHRVSVGSGGVSSPLAGDPPYGPQ
jgi:hypothetical protein